MLPTYVINMDRSQDRWENAARQLNNLAIPHVRLPAVDGNDLTGDALKAITGRKLVLWRWLRDLSAAEIGCYMSHRTAWERIANSGHPGGFVFEDDFVASPDLFAVMTALTRLNFAELPVIVKLYVPERNGPGWHRGWSAMQRPLTDQHRLALARRVQWGTLGYYISATGAGKLVGKTRRFNRPVDDAIRRVWETGVTVLTVLPAPMGHADFPSSIGPGREIARSAITNAPAYGKVYGREFNTMSDLYAPINMMRARRIFARLREL